MVLNWYQESVFDIDIGIGRLFSLILILTVLPDTLATDSFQGMETFSLWP